MDVSEVSMNDEVSMDDECSGVNVVSTGQCDESDRSHSVGVCISENGEKSDGEGSRCDRKDPQGLGTDSGWLSEAPTGSMGKRGALMLSGTEDGRTTKRDDWDHLRNQIDVEVGQGSLSKRR